MPLSGQNDPENRYLNQQIRHQNPKSQTLTSRIKERISVRESSRRRVIAALLASDLGWPQLLKATSLSKNTLRSTLRSLADSGDLLAIAKLDDVYRLKPVAVYTLTKSVRKKYESVLRVIEEIKRLENLSWEMTENTMRLLEKEKWEKQEEKSLAAYLDFIASASLIVLQSTLLWEPNGTFEDEIVATATASTARRILSLPQKIPKRMSSKAMKENLEAKRERNIKSLESENEKQRLLVDKNID